MISNLLSKIFTRRIHLLCLIFLTINILIFAAVNSIPILWQQGEITHFHFFWNSFPCANTQLCLHSGFHLSDILNIFSTAEIDHSFRTRQFSYLFEILSAKITSTFSLITFQNTLLIFLHMLNCLLLFLIVKQITNNPTAGLFIAVMALNSGIAIPTLLFPFRTAKLLATTLFLSGWLHIEHYAALPIQQLKKKLPLFFALFLAALFTDEVSLFLFLILFMTLLYRLKTIERCRELIAPLLITVGAYIFLTQFFYTTEVLLRGEMEPSYVSHNLKQLAACYQNPRALYDLFLAITWYFLRPFLGYWDLTFWGILSLFASALIGISLIQNRISKEQRFLLILIPAIFFLKAFVMIHPYGFHKDIMPPGTILPTVLFFGAYHSYPDAFLFYILLGLALNLSLRRSFIITTILACAISVINMSNYMHGESSIQSQLDNAGSSVTHQRIIPLILTIPQALTKTQKQPVYLSHPSGSQPYLLRKSGRTSVWADDPEGQKQKLLPSFMSYSSFILAKFLRPIEQGHIIISLKNIATSNKNDTSSEMQKARFFYNVPERKLLDLDILRNKSTPLGPWLNPLTTPFHLEFFIPTSMTQPRLVFFVKGGSCITITNEEETQSWRQDFGWSYQLFDIKLNAGNKKNTLTIEPLTEHQDITLAGPFLIDTTNITEEIPLPIFKNKPIFSLLPTNHQKP